MIPSFVALILVVFRVGQLKKDPPKFTKRWSEFVRSVFRRIAFDRSVPIRLALVRSAPVRLASFRDVNSSVAWLRFV